MSVLILGTNAVSMDEGVYCLKEINQVNPLGQLRRVQCITVIREMDGKHRPVEFQRDLGPTETFTADEFCFITGGATRDTSGYYRPWCEHKVGEAVEMAERRREGRWADDEPPQPRDLLSELQDTRDERRLQAKRRSMFGADSRTQRCDTWERCVPNTR